MDVCTYTCTCTSLRCDHSCNNLTFTFARTIGMLQQMLLPLSDDDILDDISDHLTSNAVHMNTEQVRTWGGLSVYARTLFKFKKCV